MLLLALHIELFCNFAKLDFNICDFISIKFLIFLSRRVQNPFNSTVKLSVYCFAGKNDLVSFLKNCMCQFIFFIISI